MHHSAGNFLTLSTDGLVWGRGGDPRSASGRKIGPVDLFCTNEFMRLMLLNGRSFSSAYTDGNWTVKFCNPCSILCLLWCREWGIWWDNRNVFGIQILPGDYCAVLPITLTTTLDFKAVFGRRGVWDVSPVLGMKVLYVAIWMNLLSSLTELNNSSWGQRLVFLEDRYQIAPEKSNLIVIAQSPVS